ncbi:MAG: hypothetical protein ACLTMP_10005 [Eggerthella lenta]
MVYIEDFKGTEERARIGASSRSRPHDRTVGGRRLRRADAITLVPKALRRRPHALRIRNSSRRRPNAGA